VTVSSVCGAPWRGAGCASVSAIARPVSSI
jgi:hypothetical protein